MSNLFQVPQFMPDPREDPATRLPGFLRHTATSLAIRVSQTAAPKMHRRPRCCGPEGRRASCPPTSL